MQMIFLILFALVITVPLMFRGLYFEKELLPTLISIYILFIAWAIYKSREKNFKILSTPIDYLFIGVVLMYLISITYGINKREAIFEFSRYLAYFIIFIMAKDFSENKKYEKGIINALLFGGVLVSIIGIGSAIGTWEYVGAVIGGRLSSTFQYPNTLAAYVSALYFIAMTALINEDKKILKVIYGSLLGNFIFALILTSSRAMWLIFPLVLIAYFIILPNTRKIESILYIISSVIISIPVAFMFNKKLPEPSFGLWYLYLLVLIGTGAVVFLISLFDSKFRKVSIKKLLISLVVIGILFSIGVVYIVNSTTSLTIENLTAEDKWTTVIRNVSSTLPSSSYDLEIDYIGTNDSESPYVGLVRVYNMDSKGELSLLSTQNLVEVGENSTKVDFTTPEDSMGIKVYFQNVYKNTKAEILSANIVDKETSSIVKKIPLKYKYLNESFVSRIQSISAGENSFVARMVFYKDGLKVLKQNPILGAGGGGWLSMYQMYQSYPYSTTLAHNYILQMWIEIGTVGVLLFVIMLIIIGFYSFNIYKRSEDTNKKTIIAGLTTTIITILVHAIVDFDMSLPSYAIMFWVIMGILANELNGLDTKITARLNKINPKVYIYGVILMACVLTYNHSMILYSQKFKDNGAIAFANNDLDTTIKNFEKVVKYDKYEGTYKMDLASCYIGKYRETNDTEYVRKAVALVDKYMELSPYDSFAYANVANFNFSIGEVDKGLDQFDKSVELQPMRSYNYTQKLMGYRAVVDFHLSRGEYDEARDILERALKVKEEIKKINEKSFRPLEKDEELVKYIGETQFMYENLDRLQDLAARGLNLDFAYYFDLDINNDENIDMLLVSKPEGSKIEHESMVEGENNFIRITNEGEVYGFKYVYPLSLEPNTTYIVELKARGNTKPETFNLYAWANGAADPNQGSLTGIELRDDWKTYSFEFTTDEDVKPGNQYIRIQHNGNDMGYIDIMDLTIFSK